MTATPHLTVALPCDEDADEARPAKDTPWGSSVEFVVFVDGDTPMRAKRIIQANGAESYTVTVELGTTPLVLHMTVPAMGVLAQAIASATVTVRPNGWPKP